MGKTACKLTVSLDSCPSIMRKYAAIIANSVDIEDPSEGQMALAIQDDHSSVIAQGLAYLEDKQAFVGDDTFCPRMDVGLHALALDVLEEEGVIARRTDMF